MEGLLLEGNIFPAWRGLQELPRLITRAPAILQVLEFNSQGKLDLALVILYLLMDRSIGRRFRERAGLSWARQGGASTVENLGAEMLTAKVWMVDDVEEFGAELQHAGLSQKSQLGVLYEREVPIPFGRPD